MLLLELRLTKVLESDARLKNLVLIRVVDYRPGKKLAVTLKFELAPAPSFDLLKLLEPRWALTHQGQLLHRFKLRAVVIRLKLRQVLLLKRRLGGSLGESLCSLFVDKCPLELL